MDAVNTQAKDQLKSFVERIENLEEQKAAIASDIKDLYEQAKSQGFDTKALRTVIRLRKQDADERRELEAVLVTYMHALGMDSGQFDMETFAQLPRRDTAPIDDQIEAMREEVRADFRANGILAAE